ncbi:hypothetical protein [Erythrobacter rubeus]|uniref:Uncharacterized protein n=1 Tax=Erythrobacter rubeus TaxID=2760803 RepID=A0ABR8KZ56_9SPHN|nr:hypothetical protein [Erythrobacter rubeus]MBD2843507.1 hypothetical protein [Erythrobacter rubeus]
MKVSISLYAGDYFNWLNAKSGSPTCDDLSQSVGFSSRRRWRKLAAGDVIRDDRGRAVCFKESIVWQCDTSLPKDMGSADEHCHDHSPCGRLYSYRRQAVPGGFHRERTAGFPARVNRA